MCILFFHFCDNPGPNGYRFIAASNRDELYERPTAQARFWDEKKKIISGVDLTPGKVGGTWLGFSKDGRFSSLTNYRQAPKYLDPKARGRGHLVTNFLQGQQKPEKYQDGISKEGALYNGFNLLVGELSSTQEPSEFAWYCNMEEQAVKVLEPGTHVLTNRFLDFPWPKAVYGKQRFSDIIDKHSDSKQELIDELLKLMNEKQRNFPDEDDSCYIGPQDPGCPEEFINGCRALYVHCKGLKYGTRKCMVVYGSKQYFLSTRWRKCYESEKGISRTNTVILVDNEGNVTYLERSMADPIDPFNPNWDVNKHEFVVEHWQAKYGTKQVTNDETVSGEVQAKTSGIEENASRKRSLKESHSEGEPVEKKMVNSGRSLEDDVAIPPEDGSVEGEPEKLDEKELNCTSTSKKTKTRSAEDTSIPQHSSLRKNVRPGVVANGRVVTNGTV